MTVTTTLTHTKLIVPFYQRVAWELEQEKAQEEKEEARTQVLLIKQEKMAKLTTSELIDAGYVEYNSGRHLPKGNGI